LVPNKIAVMLDGGHVRVQARNAGETHQRKIWAGVRRVRAWNRRDLGASRQSCNQILYNGAVQAHWRETTVGEHGELVLEGLPFEPGQPVEVLVVSKASASAVGGSLRDSVLEFREAFEPVASDDWDALR